MLIPDKTNNSLKKDKSLFKTFVVFVFCLPLPLAGNQDWAWSLLSIWSFIMLVWCCVIYWRNPDIYSKTLIKISKAWPLWSMWGIWVIYLLYSWLYVSVYPYESFNFIIKTLLMFATLILMLLLLRNQTRIRFLIKVIVWAAVFQAIYGSLMTMSGLEYGFFSEKEHYRGVATGTFVNRNHLAGYLEMAIAMGLGLLLSSIGSTAKALDWRQRVRNLAALLLSEKIRLRVFLAIMVVALVLTHSRMGNTAFFSSLLISGCIWLLLSHRKPKRSVIMLFISILIIDIVIVGNWFGIDKVVQRLENTTIETSSRDELARDTVLYIKDNLITGSGAGSFRWVYPNYRQQDIRGQNYYAHNDYLQFSAETGLIGAGILAVMVVYSMLNALIAIKKRRDPLMRGIAFGAFMGMLAIMIHSSVDFNLQIPANAVMFIILIGFSVLSMKGSKPKH